MSRRGRAGESLGQANPKLLDIIDRGYDRVRPVDSSYFVYVYVADQMGIGYLFREYALNGIFALYGLGEHQAGAFRTRVARGAFGQRALNGAVYVVEWDA